jgi:hypothetical protein
MRNRIGCNATLHFGAADTNKWLLGYNITMSMLGKKNNVSVVANTVFFHLNAATLWDFQRLSAFLHRK